MKLSQVSILKIQIMKKHLNAVNREARRRTLHSAESHDGMRDLI
jgi:hypothetical protein